MPDTKPTEGRTYTEAEKLLIEAYMQKIGFCSYGECIEYLKEQGLLK